MFSHVINSYQFKLISCNPFFGRLNTILLASCTQKRSLLSLIQAEKKVVELCSNQSKGRNFQPNSFLTQFAAQLITQR
jgi:hypothetical protein